MAAFLTASLVLALLVFSLSVSADQKIIKKPGDDVILTCTAAENKDVIVVDWSRPDLESDEYVILYRNKNLDTDSQAPSFKNRVEFLDINKKNMSLVLKNVTADDTGTYECRVVQEGKNRRKRAALKTKPNCIVYLIVEPDQKITAEPGDDIEGCKGEGIQRNKRAAPNTDNCNSNQRVGSGNMEKQKMDGGNKDEPKEDGVNRTGLIVGLSVFAVVALLVLVLYKRSRGSSPRSNPPPAAADVEETLTGTDE